MGLLPIESTYLPCLFNTYAMRGRTEVLCGGSRLSARPRNCAGLRKHKLLHPSVTSTIEKRCCNHRSKNSWNASNQVVHCTRCITPKRVTSCAQACNELRPGSTSTFKEMSQQCRALGYTVSDLTGPRLEPQTSCSRDERVTARPTNWFIEMYVILKLGNVQWLLSKLYATINKNAILYINSI